MKKIITSVIIIASIIFGVGFVYFKSIQKNAQKQTEQNLIRAKEIYDAIPIWHKKIHTEEDLKIGIITDTHVHAKRVNRDDKRDDAPRYLSTKDVTPINNFVTDMQEFEPKFIIHLGDVIEGTGDEDYVGLAGISLVKKELEKVGVPVHWVLGNHDLRSVTKNQFKDVLKLDSLQQVFDIGDYRFIILDANFNPQGGFPGPDGNNRFIPGFVPPEEIEWLKDQLATDKRVFIFMHQGIYLNKLKGDRKTSDSYGNPSKQFKMKQPVANSNILRDILKEYRVDGFFNGHMEARYYEKDGSTNYYSLTGTKKSETFPDSYYELTITDGVPDVTMYYALPGTTELKKINFANREK